MHDLSYFIRRKLNFCFCKLQTLLVQKSMSVKQNDNMFRLLWDKNVFTMQASIKNNEEFILQYWINVSSNNNH